MSSTRYYLVTIARSIETTIRVEAEGPDDAHERAFAEESHILENVPDDCYVGEPLWCTCEDDEED